MDGTTEPIIAIIGHPIAGNPTQFALESGLESAEIDCRVLSVDLPSDRVSTAVAGMDAMNFRGVWVAPSSAAAIDAVVPSGSPNLIDFLLHDASAASVSPWLAVSLKQQVWMELAAQTLDRRSHRCGKVWWIDEQTDLSPARLLAEKNLLLEQLLDSNRNCFAELTRDDIEVVNDPAHAQPGQLSGDEVDEVIVFARLTSPPASWQPPATSITLDLNENWDADYLSHWDQIKAESKGTSLRGADVHAACLSKLTELLFSRQVDPEVFQEALDEYLAV
ncbi:shikimate dehydrogenase [Allorhodopirellula solitaria]|uniref:Shikimate dehydrogenase n=1 Tax=Allorhodopirellula solitaria TaxID=2527987 RepID=A0A5C5XQN0_9BACT|nr:shikimate dehydrogenase [Allorhodopirellula solitaria]TWT65200.1 hypothetical protein CA85_31090 [Allorhodopirellula solitaria]